MEFFLEKGLRSHKYVKRTGTPGNYKYWYKMPDGSIQAPDDAQHQGKVDHVKRLILGKQAGHHEMDTQAIAAHTGLEHGKVQSAKRNLARHGTEWRGRTFSHGYEDEHIREGHAAVGSHEGTSHESPTERAHRVADAAARTRAMAEVTAPARPRRSRSRSAIPEGMAGEGESSGAPPRRPRRAAAAPATERHTVPADRPTPAPARHPVVETALNDMSRIAENQRASNASSAEQKRARLRELGVNLGSPAPAATPAATPAAPAEMTPEKVAEIGSKIKSAIRGLTRRVERVEDPEKSGTGVHVLFHHDKSDGRIFTSRDGEEDDDFPDFTGQDKVIQAVSEALGDGWDVTAYDHEKGMFSVEAKPKAAAAPAPAPSTRQRAARAATAVRSASLASPSQPAARELHAVSPDLAAADAPISRMEEAAAAGENPYLHRATEIFHNIMGDLKPERREVCKHVLQAVADLKAGGAPLNEANLVARYKHLSGKNIRGISGIAEDFEKGTFMSLQEVMDNKPVDPEIERMKRGYAAKQFARLKPFLKKSFSDANPSAPPPMPTFGDIKSWGEHDSPKPAWAGQTRLAMPKDVFDAAHKGPDGKPKYPPAWMPIHMMPVWNYVMKKSGDDSPYQTRNVNIQQGKLKLGSQAQHQEGFVIAALRKYVQMRGGAHQLNDIPSHKLSEVGLTHSDIFKATSAQLSDSEIKKIIRHKIVDPVALLPFLKREIKSGVRKSFSLVVNQDLGAIDFRKSFVVNLSKEEIKKAELIQKIKALKAARG